MYKLASAPGFRVEFIKQLDKVFGGRHGWCYLEDGVIQFSSSTVGWHNALYKTCTQLGHFDFWSWYEALPWEESDEIDTILEGCLLGIEPFQDHYML